MARIVVVAVLALWSGLPVNAGVMLQGFYTDVPSPAAGNGSAPWWWDKMGGQANALRQAGFTAVWLPPVLKGAGGGYSNGYDVFDDYDLGSKNQSGTYPTRYGTREQLQRCVAMLRANGLAVYVDLVANHRNGDDGFFNFRYINAYGTPNAGRFQKGPLDFHPNVGQDPNVPDDSFSFGRDVSHINGGNGYVYNEMNKAGDWLTKSLDIQGYRLDNVKGISTNWLRPFLYYGAMNGKFAVGEYFDGNIDSLLAWIYNGDNGYGMQGRSSLFDFPLRFTLKEMCDSGGFFDMSRLDRAGLVGRDPAHAVTFVENHDTDGSGSISQNKMLAYAYILTSEGYPCVFYKDFSTDYGSYGLQAPISNLMWIHEMIAAGGTEQRFKDGDVFAFERTGGARLLAALNDNGGSSRTVTVATGFGGNVQLHDYTGHSGDVWTDGNGYATITIPQNVNGSGYVAYSRAGISGSFAVPSYNVTQEFAGALDLDIKPADNTTLVPVGRVYVAAGKKLTAALFCDKAGWTSSTSVYLDVLNPAGAKLWYRLAYAGTVQGAPVSVTASTTGWYTFRIRSYNTPASNSKPAYWLKVNYAAPQQ